MAELFPLYSPVRKPWSIYGRSSSGRAKRKQPMASADGKNNSENIQAQAEKPSLDPVLRKSQFEELAWPLMDALYAMGLKLHREPAKSEDLVQETYLRAWKSFDRFTLGTNFKAWIFQIMMYLYLNERRGAQYREVASDFSDQEIAVETVRKGQAADVVAQAAEQLLEEESNQADSKVNVAPWKEMDWAALYPDVVDDVLKGALDRLPDDQRLVFFLITLGELSYQECSTVLSVPIGTVMSRLFRARKQLQDELAEYAVEHGIEMKNKGG